MSTPDRPFRSLDTIRLRIRLLQLGLDIHQMLQASASPEEQRAEVETPYPQGSPAAEDYIDGYLDYQNASMQFEDPQCRGDRSSYYGQGWQARANDLWRSLL